MQAFSKGKSAVYLQYAGHPETKRLCHLEAVAICDIVFGLGHTPSRNRTVPPSATLKALIRCGVDVPDSWLQLPFPLSLVLFANIQVAGDTQLLQVFEHRGHWQHKLQFGCRDAQPAEGGSPSFPAAFEYLASFRSSQLPEQRAPRGRQLCTSFGHGCLGVPRFLLGGSFAELLPVPSAPRTSARNSSRVVTEALKATMPDGAYPKTSLVDLA